DEEVPRVGLGVCVPCEDLDAAGARFAQDGGDGLLVLDAHRDRVDAARDPRLDHLVLLRGIRFGRPVPQQPDPQLLRGLVRAGASAREVGIALALGHHRDGLPPLGAPRSAAAARDHAQDQRQRRPPTRALHACLLPWRTWFAPSAARSSAAVITPASSAGRSARRRPFCRTASVASPSSVPPTLPRPPKIDVPPRTTAVMAISSKPVPASAFAWPSRATYSTAAIPAQRPEST